MTKNILIINNDTIELRRLREILTREGFDIMTATNKETAREICKRLPIVMILADTETLEFCHTIDMNIKK